MSQVHEKIKNLNPIYVHSQEEREAWLTMHPDVPVKVVLKPAENLNPVYLSSKEEAEMWGTAHPEVPVKVTPESKIIENMVEFNNK